MVNFRSHNELSCKSTCQALKVNSRFYQSGQKPKTKRSEYKDINDRFRSRKPPKNPRELVTSKSRQWKGISKKIKVLFEPSVTKSRCKQGNFTPKFLTRSKFALKARQPGSNFSLIVNVNQPKLQYLNSRQARDIFRNGKHFPVVLTSSCSKHVFITSSWTQIRENKTRVRSNMDHEHSGHSRHSDSSRCTSDLSRRSSSYKKPKEFRPQRNKLHSIVSCRCSSLLNEQEKHQLEDDKNEKSLTTQQCLGNDRPDIYRRVLGPTPDETILAGLQTVIEMCSVTQKQPRRCVRRSISAVSNNQNVIEWADKEYSSLERSSEGSKSETSLHNIEERKQNLQQIKKLVKRKTELDQEARKMKTKKRHSIEAKPIRNKSIDRTSQTNSTDDNPPQRSKTCKCKAKVRSSPRPSVNDDKPEEVQKQSIQTPTQCPSTASFTPTSTSTLLSEETDASTKSSTPTNVSKDEQSAKCNQTSLTSNGSKSIDKVVDEESTKSNQSSLTSDTSKAVDKVDKESAKSNRTCLTSNTSKSDENCSCSACSSSSESSEKMSIDVSNKSGHTSTATDNSSGDVTVSDKAVQASTKICNKCVQITHDSSTQEPHTLPESSNKATQTPEQSLSNLPKLSSSLDIDSLHKAYCKSLIQEMINKCEVVTEDDVHLCNAPCLTKPTSAQSLSNRKMQKSYCKILIQDVLHQFKVVTEDDVRPCNYTDSKLEPTIIKKRNKRESKDLQPIKEQPCDECEHRRSLIEKQNTFQENEHRVLVANGSSVHTQTSYPNDLSVDVGCNTFIKHIAKAKKLSKQNSSPTRSTNSSNTSTLNDLCIDQDSSILREPSYETQNLIQKDPSVTSFPQEPSLENDIPLRRESSIARQRPLQRETSCQETHSLDGEKPSRDEKCECKDGKQRASVQQETFLTKEPRSCLKQFSCVQGSASDQREEHNFQKERSFQSEYSIQHEHSFPQGAKRKSSSDREALLELECCRQYALQQTPYFAHDSSLRHEPDSRKPDYPIQSQKECSIQRPSSIQNCMDETPTRLESIKEELSKERVKQRSPKSSASDWSSFCKDYKHKHKSLSEPCGLGDASRPHSEKRKKRHSTHKNEKQKWKKDKSPCKRKTDHCKCNGDSGSITSAARAVRYAIVRISKFERYSTFEVLKSSKRKPNVLPASTESIFVLKNKPK